MDGRYRLVPVGVDEWQLQRYEGAASGDYPEKWSYAIATGADKVELVAIAQNEEQQSRSREAHKNSGDIVFKVLPTEPPTIFVEKGTIWPK